MKSRSLILYALALIVFIGVAIAAGNAQSAPIVRHDIYHDTSLPVREYATFPVASQEAGAWLDEANRPFHAEHPRPVRKQWRGPMAVGADVAEEVSSLSTVSAVLGSNFEGIPNIANGTLVGIPPDPNLSVGATQVVEVINSAYEVFDKASGQSFFPPQQISTIFSGMPGLCGQGVTFFFTDPIVVYDKIAGRWVIGIVAYDNTGSHGNECIAVSATSDATGRYYRYAFKFGANTFPDYPKLAVWPDGYYASYNLFTPTNVYGTACAYDRARMLVGKSTAVVCFENASEFSYLPSDLDGATLPPAGEPNFFIDLFDTSSLHLYRFHADFKSPADSVFFGPLTIAVKPFTPACGGGACIPQLGTSQQLDTLSDRLMFRLAYRNFGSHESLVVNHSVQTSVADSGVRWYEIRRPDDNPRVYQQGTFTDADRSAWMASIAMDKAGDIGLGFSESNSSMHPAIAYTGRVQADPPNQMELPAMIYAGNGSQTGADRWGDYSGLAIDTVDDCTFWYVNEYYAVDNGY
ncbi:MAG: hypothetical protein JOY93_10510, partial [Acidobacteriales bacterium]|nr:hypothetical protein [Terriglobales bacterium]